MAVQTVSPAFTLPSDHPGRSDTEYLARRAAIAHAGETFRSGDPIPDVTYTPEEDAVWCVVSAELAAKHARLACRPYRIGAARLHLPSNRVPQLREVDATVHELSGWHINPVPGLVPTRQFYGSLADRTFLSTQYIRHHSVPFYTPEPDIVHEIIGHANALGSPAYADLYERAGRASRRATTDESLDVFSRVWWFTMEFGVVMEKGQHKAYGAGLLSSYGEIEVFGDAEIRPWNLHEMATLPYDITQYQPVLFAAESFDHMTRDLGVFFDTFDDATAEQLIGDGR